MVGCSVPGPSVSAGSAPKLRVAALNGPTAVGMVHLMQDHPAAAADGYEYVVSDSPDEVAAKVLNGDVDLAAVPTNLAAVLYAKTSGAVQMLAVNTLGVMYVVSDDPSVTKMADLRGKTIYATGQGSNPEYVLRFLLQRSGLDPDRDVKLVFLSQHDELATRVASGRVRIAVLPEPFVTMVAAKNPQVKVAVDLNAVWNSTVSDGSQLMMGALIGRKSLLARETGLVATFLARYKASIEAAQADIPGTAMLCQNYRIIPSAALAEKAMPRLNLTYLAGAPMKAGIQGYYQVLYDANPTSVGGAIPDAGFYFAAG